MTNINGSTEAAYYFAFEDSYQTGFLKVAENGVTMSFLIARHDLSGMPLISLPAVVLDTETTGLNVAEDRVIELGAVHLDGGHVVADKPFSELIQPGLAIPPQSTEIHHITDSDVAGCREFEAVMHDFVQWAGPAVMIGYSFGFDLAILKAEHDRHGMNWQTPVSLDVRHFVQILGPQLPEQSLETVASWLGVDVTDRHRALADATLTAKVFLALIPLLRERGITTLAQAERAKRLLTTTLDNEVQAGWSMDDGSEQSERSALADFARIDSFPYRHRVSELMSSPALTVSADAPLSDVLGILEQNGVSSTFYALENETHYGIITERDALRAFAASGAEAMSIPVSDLGSAPLVTIEQSEFVYRALATLAAKKFRHLGVVDHKGRLVGALSARDLLRQRADEAVALGNCIQIAHSRAALGSIWAELTTIVQALVVEDVDARVIASVISRELRALTRRACELAEKEMAKEGLGEPPVGYSMLVLGSGGRGESLLAMDQDNAIIFEKGEPGGDTDKWFAELGKRVSDILNEAGVPYCNGGVMAANDAWRHDEANWNDVIQSWIGRARPEDILNCDIFFDAAPVYGDMELAERLRANAIKIASNSPNFLKFLALNANDFETPTGFLGRIKLENGRVDLKKAGILPIFSTARVEALRHGILKHSTPDRLTALRALHTRSDKTIDNLIEAHRILLNLILRQQLTDIDAGIPQSNSVAERTLSAYDRQQLKWAINQIPSVRDLLGLPNM